MAIRRNGRVSMANIAWTSGIQLGSFSLAPQLPTTAMPHSGPKRERKMKIALPLIDSVILEEEKKEEIRAAISQIKHNDLIFDKWGFSEVFEKGTAVSLLFHGLPGTGKTLMAQAIANELNAELKIYGTAELQTSEPGGVDCGEKDIVVLEFDHVRGEKKMNISSMVSAYCLKTIQGEIEKCDIRCANCHRKKTAKERNYF